MARRLPAFTAFISTKQSPDKPARTYATACDARADDDDSGLSLILDFSSKTQHSKLNQVVKSGPCARISLWVLHQAGGP
jgi:hypothetical protein